MVSKDDGRGEEIVKSKIHETINAIASNAKPNFLCFATASKITIFTRTSWISVGINHPKL